MLGTVPASGGQIDAAAEREAPVHHHDLLVMARGGRMVGVQDKVEATRLRHAELQLGQRLAVQAEEHRPVPDQDPDPQDRPDRRAAPRRNSCAAAARHPWDRG